MIRIVSVRSRATVSKRNCCSARRLDNLPCAHVLREKVASDDSNHPVLCLEDIPARWRREISRGGMETASHTEGSLDPSEREQIDGYLAKSMQDMSHSFQQFLTVLISKTFKKMRKCSWFRFSALAGRPRRSGKCTLLEEFPDGWRSETKASISLPKMSGSGSQCGKLSAPSSVNR
jgi:hypothetical protein